MGDPAEAASESRRGQDWESIYRRLSTRDAAAPLPVDDLEALATAAYLTGRDETSFDLWGRASREHTAAGALDRAASCGTRAAQALTFKGDIARARGWADRTFELIAGHNRACVEAGYLDHVNAMLAIFEEGDVAMARDLFTAAGGQARTFGDRELVTLAQIGEGRCRIYLGELAAGVALLDQAMVAVEAGEVSPLVIGDSYCTVIDACTEIFDVGRARSWTSSFTRWCDDQAGLVLFQGHCLLHRAEVMQLGGSWTAGLDEARRACTLLTEPPNPMTLGGAHYIEGELQRLLGNFEAAEHAYRRANEVGSEPQPGLSLLRKAQGQIGTAERSIRRVEEETGDDMGRARFLAAYVEIVLATGDVSNARSGAEELNRIAEGLRSEFLRAQAAYAIGSVSLAEGNPQAALGSLRRARSQWGDLAAPYEGARTRLLIAGACATIGDDDTADLDTSAARATFEELGAVAELNQLNVDESAPPGGLTGRQLEVLGLVAAGKTNRAIAAELFISEKTVASHVSNIFTRLGIASRSAATAYAYENGLV